MKIDVHTHILPQRLPRFAERFGYQGFIELEPSGPCTAKMVFDDGRFFRDIESNCWDPERRIEESLRSGVSQQVLSTVPVMFNYWAKARDNLVVSQFLNDHIASVVRRFPRAFFGLGTLPMQDSELAAGELIRVVSELDLKGVQIGTHVEGVGLDDSRFFPVYEEAQRLNAVILVHPWDMLSKDRMQKFWLSWLVGMPTETALAISQLVLGGIFERFPKIRFAFSHGGGSYASLHGRVAAGYQARPDLVAIESKTDPKKWLGHFFVDSITHDSQTLKNILSVFGEHRVMLGSDYPFPLGEKIPGAMIESMPEVSGKTRELLLCKNAEEWLGICDAI